MAWTEPYLSKLELRLHNLSKYANYASPGVYWLQDPRSRVYNFPPYLQTIPRVDEFAFSRVEGFIKSSADKVSRDQIFELLYAN